MPPISLDGWFGPVFFEVGTGVKSPIAQLIVIKAHSAQRCHGHVFQERKKLEAD
jgi:hypothetical protein